MPSTNQRAEGCFFKSKLPLGKLVWMLLSWASDIISVGWAAYNNVAKINGGVRLQDAEIHTNIKRLTDPNQFDRFKSTMRPVIWIYSF